ncbi:MAG: LA2681 family HEPN domain-containing protein [Crocosphaera sp.]
MEEYSQELDELEQLYKTNQYDKALEKAQFLLDKYPNLQDINFSCSGILINIGEVTKNLKIINQGIDIIQNELNNLDDYDEEDLLNYELHLQYNLSNGYSSQASLLNPVSDQNEIEEALLKQKRCLQKILLNRKKLSSDPDFLSSVITNYANLLRDSGRSIEAIDYYYDCLAIYPNHAIAMANCGSLLLKTLNLSVCDNTKILYEALQLMKEANQHPSELEKRGGHHLIDDYQRAFENFQEYLESLNTGGAKSLEEYMIGWQNIHTWEPSSFLKQVKDDRLLLTVNPRPTNCPSEYKEDLVFKEIIVPLDENGEKWFQSLAYTWNNIKEEFVTARYLYYQSQSQDNELLEISKMTSYLRSYNWDDWGLRSGFLKTSLRLGLDILDKCACFINLYLSLGHPEELVTMTNVWYKKMKHNKGMLETIEERLTTNTYLLALLNIKKDLATQNEPPHYPYPFKTWRNHITHQRFTLFLDSPWDSEDNTCDLQEFQEAVRILLRIVKAAIIYLVGVVMVEENYQNEQRKANGTDKKVCEGMPLEIDIGLSDEFDTLEE